MRTTRPAAILLLLILSGCAVAIENVAPLPAWTPPICPPDQVNLLVFGDWGDGSDNQKKVAATLADYAAAHGPVNAVLSAGDNIYASLKDAGDPKWRTLFEEMYDIRKLNVPFYAILGNHDYEKKKDLIELDYAAKNSGSRFKMPARWYRLEFPAEKPLITILMLDSNKTLTAAQAAEQRQWIEQELARPRQTRWLAVCDHHPLFSNGDHGDERRIQQAWGPLFRKHNVDFVFSGHDHAMQHLRPPDWNIDFVIAGGGGRKRTNIKRNDRGPFFRSIYGFAHARFTANSAEITMVEGVTGEIVHRFSRSAQGDLKIVQTTPNDKPAAAAVARVNTPAHRAIKNDGDGFKEMASVLSFSASPRAAFDKAVKTGDTREVIRALSLPQQQRWAGYRLYSSVIDTFKPVALSDEQKQQAFAACAALATVSVDANTADKNPTLEPAPENHARAIDIIREQILSSAQRKTLAEHADED